MKHRNGRKRKAGFTLIELLLAITLFGIVMASCYGIFSMGIQIWRRTQGPLLTERKILLAVERISGDLRETFRTQKEILEASGNQNRFAVPRVVTHYGKKKGGQTQLGRVRYEWDPGARTLCRREESMSQLYRKKEAPCRVLAEAMERFQFQYLLEKLEGSYSWYDQFGPSDGIPAAVRISLAFRPKMQGGKTGARKEFIKTVLIPAGGKT